MKVPFPFALVLLVSIATAQSKTDDFSTTERFYSDQMGTRLVVSPAVQAGSRIRDLELRLLDEPFFDHDQSDFITREVAFITGGGLGSPGLIFHVDNPQGQEKFIQILEEFQRKTDSFRSNRRALENLEEDWMGGGATVLNQSRVFAHIQTDFLNRPSKVTLNWNLEANRLWLSIDGFINLDSRIAEPLLRLIERIPVYSRQRARYAEAIATKSDRINGILNITPDSPRDGSVVESAESSADY